MGAGGAIGSRQARQRQRGGAHGAGYAGARALPSGAIWKRGKRTANARTHARGQQPGPRHLAARFHGESTVRIRGLRFLCVAACVSALGAVGNGYAQWAVIDVSNLQQNIQQYMQMVEQVNQLKAQLEQLKDQYRAMTGSYGVGGLLQEETFAAGSIVPGSWQEVVRLQQAGKYKSKLDFYENLMKTVDPALFEKNATRSAGAYKLSYDNTRAAFAVTDATYESVETHRRNIEQLVRRIDSTQRSEEHTSE